MRKWIAAAVAGLSLAFVPALSSAQNAIAVTVPAKAGPVTGRTENSDAFIWGLFTQFAAPAVAGRPSPVVFETWASDADTFSTNPVWPKLDAPRVFHASLLEVMKRPAMLGPAKRSPHVAALDVKCATPGNAAAGGFPTMGPPLPCIAEETKRNRPQFDYIVSNKLNTQAGLAKAFAANFAVDMPTSAIAVKGDWVPVQTMMQWLPKLLPDVAAVRTFYYVTNSGGIDYALVSLHVSSRQNVNWVWGSFEHQFNPGRCDSIGCWDTFGATRPAIAPNVRTANTQYGACAKTAQLQTLMRTAKLSPVWDNYCLKSTEVDYSAPDGTPYALGNSVIERIVGNGTISASSCIACHVYASFGRTGAPTKAAVAMLPYNPTGTPIAAVFDTVSDKALKFDFMWGVILAP